MQNREAEISKIVYCLVDPSLGKVLASAMTSSCNNHFFSKGVSINFLHTRNKFQQKMLSLSTAAKVFSPGGWGLLTPSSLNVSQVNIVFLFLTDSPGRELFLTLHKFMCLENQVTFSKHSMENITVSCSLFVKDIILKLLYFHLLLDDDSNKIY